MTSSILRPFLLIPFAILLSSCASSGGTQGASTEEAQLDQMAANEGTAASEKDEDTASENGILEPAEPADAIHAEESGDEDGDGQETSDNVKKASSGAPLSEDKKQLKEQIESVERESLGDPKLKTLGLYGDLKACRMKLNSKAYGGTGELFWDEPGDRLSEKWLSDSDVGAKEFQATLMIVKFRRDYLNSELKACELELSKRTKNSGESLAVNVTEGDSDNDERVRSYICRFVKKGASLRDFLVQTFSRGLLQLEHFDLDQEFLVASLKDKAGTQKPHGLMFMGWKLVFDRGPLNLDQVIFDKKDASMVAWTFFEKDKVSDAKSCLPKDSGLWNP
tara:strand:- start:468 stop:1475 length:1008 start_codon:yes stop_codon:yes gene_type:complete